METKGELTTGQAAQAAFLATFPEGYVPQIDTRTPQDLRQEQDEA